MKRFSLNMEEAGSSETSVSYHVTTRRQNQEYRDWNRGGFAPCMYFDWIPGHCVIEKYPVSHKTQKNLYYSLVFDSPISGWLITFPYNTDSEINSLSFWDHVIGFPYPYAFFQATPEPIKMRRNICNNFTENLLLQTDFGANIIL